MNENALGISALCSRMEELGLVFMASGLESFLADQARSETTLLDSVRALVDLEYVARKERTARTRLKLSGMPQSKRLDDFDLSWLKGGLPRERFEKLIKVSPSWNARKTYCCWVPRGSAKPTCCSVWGIRPACRVIRRIT